MCFIFEMWTLITNKYYSTVASVTVALLLVLFFPVDSLSFSGTFFIADEREVFGFTRNYTIRKDEETLINLQQQFALGYNEIKDANPGIDPWYPGAGRRILLPSAWILPDVNGLEDPDHDRYIIINLAEFRLYYVAPQGDRISVTSFPIGIGREGWDTPLGRYGINEKMEDPSWVVPASIKAESPWLPNVVPPGPDNPLGKHAIRLSAADYLIHGTNQPLGIGRRVSHGCIRMSPGDIKWLYSVINMKESVFIVYQPVKVGRKAETPYIEVHGDYLNRVNLLQDAVDQLKKFHLMNRVDMKHLYSTILHEKRGIPVPLK
jgi:L,D-transpeptidase ErfK/SrfK